MVNQFLTLSLFMMLLSFFMILNSISEFEETKAKSVLNSISIAFSRQTIPDNLLPEEKSDSMQSVKSGSALDHIQSLFTDQISGVKVAKNRFGTQMKIRLAVREFEKMLAVPIGDKQKKTAAELQTKSLLPVLLSLMDGRENIPYRMDVLLHIQDTAELEETEQKIRNVSGYVTRIRNLGLPQKLITSGITPGEEGVIDLVFKRYTPFNLSATQAQETLESQEN